MFGEDGILGWGCALLLATVIVCGTALVIVAMLADHSVASQVVKDILG